MTSPSIHPGAPGLPPVRVGRLKPLPGVVLRDHPDRVHVRQLLRELHAPLRALREMLDECEGVTLPENAAVALTAADSHAGFVQRLLDEFGECGRLEQDQVRPAPHDVSLPIWLEARLATARASGTSYGIDVETVFRSLVPDVVSFDAALAERALDHVLGVALLRAHGRRVDVRVAFEQARRRGARAQLVFEVSTRGGGFAGIEQGYAFAPFQVRDAASRPLLGLTIGQRLCELLGGELSLDSPGRSVCHYRVTFAVEPVAAAVWVDPLGARDEPVALGPVTPAR